MLGNAVEILITARDEATAVIARTEGSLASLGGSINGVAAVAGTISLVATAAALAGTAVVRMGKDLADNVEQLDRLSVRTGVSIERLQVMQRVVAEGGGNVESLTTALSFLNRAIATHNPLLAQMGINTTDAFTALMQLGQAFASSDDAAAKNAISFKLLGRGGADLIADVEAIPGAFGAMDSALRQSGNLITEEMAPAIRDLDAQMDEFGRNWSGFWQKARVAAVAPAAEILQIVNDLSKAPRAVGDFLAHLNPFAAFAGAGAGAGMTPEAMAAGAKNLKETGVEAHMPGVGPSGLDKMIEFLNVIPSSERPLAELRKTWVELGKLKPDAKVFVQELKVDALQQVLADWHGVVNDITSTAGVLRDTLGAVWNGLQQGFSAVFAGLFAKGQTFKSAMITLFAGLRDAILQQLASIVASQIFKIFLTLAGNLIGGPLGAAAGAAAGSTMGSPGFSYPKATAQMPSPGRMGGNTYNVYALDNLALVQSLVAGDLRTAHDTLRFRGAY